MLIINNVKHTNLFFFVLRVPEMLYYLIYYFIFDILFYYYNVIYYITFSSYNINKMRIQSGDWNAILVFSKTV